MRPAQMDPLQHSTVDLYEVRFLLHVLLVKLWSNATCVPFAVQATNIHGRQSPSSPPCSQKLRCSAADRMCRVADSIIHSWKFEIHTIRVLLHHS